MKNKIRYRQQAPPTPVQQKQGKVAYSSVNPFNSNQTVQREVWISEHKTENDKEQLKSYEARMDKSVQTAFAHLLAAPGLGTLASLDGHTQKWVDDWDEFVNGNRPGSFNTSFGYAVESLATLVYTPTPPDQMSNQFQAYRKGTRPDVVLIDKSGDVAWLDITAYESRDHIWEKNGWKDQEHVAEILYPSLAPEHLNVMSDHKDFDTPESFDPEDFKEQIKKAKKLHTKRQKKWKELGQRVREQYDSVRNKSRDVRNNNPKLICQNPTLEILIDIFQLEIEKPIKDKNIVIDQNISDSKELAELRSKAPGILSALQLGPAYYGFRGKGAKGGEAWLLQNDPYLAQPDDVEEETRSKKKRERENDEQYETGEKKIREIVPVLNNEEENDSKNN